MREALRRLLVIIGATVSWSPALVALAACSAPAGASAANGRPSDDTGGAAAPSAMPATQDGGAGSDRVSDPDWAFGMRMVDVVMRTTFPATPAEVTYDAGAVHALIKAAADSGASVVQLHFSVEVFYADWIDDGGFAKNIAALTDAATYAHGLGLKSIVYMNGCEVMSPGANPSGAPQGIDPTKMAVINEHPDWLQLAPSGKPIWYSGLTEAQADYVLGTDWEDAWVSPLGPYRALFLARAAAVVKAGADGIFVDVANLPGNSELVAPLLGLPEAEGHVGGCYNAECLAAFAAAYPGAAKPSAANHLDWTDDGFRRWEWFRHRILRDYYADMEAAVRAVNPSALVLAESSENDVPGDIVDFGFDNTQMTVSVTPELTPILPEDGACMSEPRLFAGYYERVKYHAGLNRQHGRSYTPLGSAVDPEDAAIQLAMSASTGGGYFTFDQPTSALTAPFAFLKRSGEVLRKARPAARVAVLTSPHTRDFVDRNNGGLVDTSGTVHFAAYRRVLDDLVDAHIPFEVLVAEQTTPQVLAAFDVVIAPEVRCMSDAMAEQLRAFAAAGKTLIAIGQSASLDLWGQPAPRALAGAKLYDAGAAWDATLIADAGATAVVLAGDHGIAGQEPVIADVTFSAAGSAMLHLINLTPARKSECPLAASPVADLAVTVPCTLLSKCGATKATLHTYGTGAPSDPALVPVTSADGALRLTIPALPSYAFVVFED